MGISENDAKMEGWLYTIRSNRFGLQFSRKRYFILQNHLLKIYKAIPISDQEEPARRATIDSSIRVTDGGRESIHRKVFFIFSLYSTSNHHDQLKLGARSSEEAARWICCLNNATLKESPAQAQNSEASPKNRWTSLSRKGSGIRSIGDWPSANVDTITSDVIEPSTWKIFGCKNDLKLFKEAKETDSCIGRHHGDDPPAVMAVGVVDETSEQIFHAVMDLGPARLGWDFCLYEGNVVVHINGHTDIIHEKLYGNSQPWGMTRRDLLLQRYWRREDDGTYVILFHSVVHKKCPPLKGYVRAVLKNGGYIITPTNHGKQSVVKHMLAIDWKFWKSYVCPASGRSLTIHMLERVSALRELFKAKQRNYSSEDLSEECIKDIYMHQIEKENAEIEIQSPQLQTQVEDDTLIDHEEKTPSAHANLMSLNEDPDEFFDVPEASESTDYYSIDSEWYSDISSEEHHSQPKLASAAGIVRKLHDLAIQKKGYMDLQDVVKEDSTKWFYGASLQQDTWSVGDPSAFLIRGKNYLKDQLKIEAKETLMQIVGADWLRSEKRKDDLGSRAGGIVQKYAEQGGSEYFFIVNMQIPGSPMHALAMYFMMKTPLEDHPQLYNFINRDDAYRNSRFKLIPYISKGPWIVKQSVGKKACLLGQTFEACYFRGKNYFEVDINVGSSKVARGISNLVLPYFNKVIIELAFLIQGNTQEELPETFLGTCRLNHLDVSKAQQVMP